MAYTHTDVGNLIGNADQSGNPGSGQGDQCSAGMFRLPEPTDSILDRQILTFQWYFPLITHHIKLYLRAKEAETGTSIQIISKKNRNF